MNYHIYALAEIMRIVSELQTKHSCSKYFSWKYSGFVNYHIIGHQSWILCYPYRFQIFRWNLASLAGFRTLPTSQNLKLFVIFQITVFVLKQWTKWCNAHNNSSHFFFILSLFWAIFSLSIPSYFVACLVNVHDSLAWFFFASSFN